MIKFLDKFVPTICILSALFFLASAMYLKADTTFQNINIKPEQEEIKPKTKILLVPGHDFEHVGAFAGKIKESELTLKTATFLKVLLEKDSDFEVYVTREKLDKENLGNENSIGKNSQENKNDYTNAFQKYFIENREVVLQYRDFHKKETEKRGEEDRIDIIDHVEHNNTSEEMSYKLYAINKWVEDNKIDIVIHIHFNDYPNRKKPVGKYEGFSIYVPHESLKNGKVSQEFSKFIGDSLEIIFDYSNLPVESLGIIPTDDLIAVGANNTISAASILIEYGYIYENKFQDDEILKKTAEQTYLGIKKYLGAKR